MDPNQALEDALELAHALQDGEATRPEQAAEELATLVIELDAWIRRGGFLPEAWGRPYLGKS